MATNTNPITITILTDAEVGYCAKATIKIPGLGTAIVRGKWRPSRETALNALRRPLARKLATFTRQAERLEIRAQALRSIVYSTKQTMQTASETASADDTAAAGVPSDPVAVDSNVN